jgi:hypothetical protein
MPVNLEPLPNLQEAGKLTDWENEPTVEDLRQDFTAARSDHYFYREKISKWRDNLFVEGSAKIAKKPGRSTVVPKLIRKQAEWRYSSLSEPFLSQEELFKARPRTHADTLAAHQNAQVLNYQFDAVIDKVRFIDEYVRTAVDEGTIIVRVGWEFNEEEQDVEVPIVKLKPVTDPAQVQALLEQGKDPLVPAIVGTRTEKQLVTTVNRPTIRVCDYKDVIIDPTAEGNLNKAQFIIFGFDTSLSQLEKMGSYQNLDQVDVERNSILSEPDVPSEEVKSFQFNDKPRKKIRAWEYWGYWDIEGNGKTESIVATWIGETMIRMEKNPFPDKKLPFVLVQYLPRIRRNYGEPDGELLEENQKIAGAVTRGMIDIMGRSAAGQKGIRLDALDVTNRKRFESGEDYQFAAHVDPRQAFHDHVYPEIPASAQFMLQLQQAEAESLTGVKAFQGGLDSDSLGKVATGIRGVLDAAAKRELGILRRLAEGIKEIGYKIAAMNAEFLSDEEFIRIADEPVKINRENLVGKFDLILDISSSETDNIKAQELAFMLQTMGNNMPPQMSQLVLADIARLRKMYELEKQIREYRFEPDPMDQQIKQLEVMKLQAEIKKLESESRNEVANGMFEMAKAQETQAKTRLLGGQADKLDLDFLEQQSGAAHAKELEKQGAQARANMMLKERESQLKDRNTFLGKALDFEKEKLKNTGN